MVTNQTTNDQEERQAEQQARAWILEMPSGDYVRPRDTQSFSKGRISFNAACRVLEALEKDGELVRDLRGGTLCWSRARPAASPSRCYRLPLSPREHGALLRLLDGVLDWQNRADLPKDADLLRAVRNKLKRPS